VRGAGPLQFADVQMVGVGEDGLEGGRGEGREGGWEGGREEGREGGRE
jgi:hypothetical protein